jgi:hypothetical protein
MTMKYNQHSFSESGNSPPEYRGLVKRKPRPSPMGGPRNTPMFSKPAQKSPSPSLPVKKFHKLAKKPETEGGITVLSCERILGPRRNRSALVGPPDPFNIDVLVKELDREASGVYRLRVQYPDGTIKSRIFDAAKSKDKKYLEEFAKSIGCGDNQGVYIASADVGKGLPVSMPTGFDAQSPVFLESALSAHINESVVDDETGQRDGVIVTREEMAQRLRRAWIPAKMRKSQSPDGLDGEINAAFANTLREQKRFRNGRKRGAAGMVPGSGGERWGASSDLRKRGSMRAPTNYRTGNGADSDEAREAACLPSEEFNPDWASSGQQLNSERDVIKRPREFSAKPACLPAEHLKRTRGLKGNESIKCPACGHEVFAAGQGTAARDRLKKVTKDVGRERIPGMTF